MIEFIPILFSVVTITTFIIIGYVTRPRNQIEHEHHSELDEMIKGIREESDRVESEINKLSTLKVQTDHLKRLEARRRKLYQEIEDDEQETAEGGLETIIESETLVVEMHFLLYQNRYRVQYNTGETVEINPDTELCRMHKESLMKNKSLEQIQKEKRDREIKERQDAEIEESTREYQKKFDEQVQTIEKQIRKAEQFYEIDKQIRIAEPSYKIDNICYNHETDTYKVRTNDSNSWVPVNTDYGEKLWDQFGKAQVESLNRDSSKTVPPLEHFAEGWHQLEPAQLRSHRSERNYWTIHHN